MQYPRSGKCHRFSKRLGQSSRERGYVLLLCLVVIAISSSIVVTTFQILKLHTAEASARRDLVNVAAIHSAGTEHGLAHLIDQPAFRGTLGPFMIPNQTDQNYRIQIGDVGGDIQIEVVAAVGTRLQTITTRIRVAELDARRQALGLAKPTESAPVRPSDATQQDAKQEDAKQEDAKRGEAKREEATRGEAKREEAKREEAKGKETNRGEAKRVIPPRGEATRVRARMSADGK